MVKTTKTLLVYLEYNYVGNLSLNEAGQLVFCYADSWLTQSSAMALSLSLPLTSTPYVEGSARSFFANLLPEGEIREVIARKLGNSKGNDFALLAALGGECAGAIRLLPSASWAGLAGDYQALTKQELAEQIANLAHRPMLVGDKGIRLSLAGAQDKLPIYWRNGEFYLAKEGAPSSHILKPPLRHYPDSVENEFFCMSLANAIGLPVPRVSYYHAPSKFYLIERYDRMTLINGQLQRLHQEDFCQALGYLPERKYEKEGGPSFLQCFTLIKQASSRPANDLKMLMLWLIFNYLIGNNDAHAKNLAFILSREGPVLAPFYDLLCTAVYPELNQEMAMRIANKYAPDWVLARHWQSLAMQLGIKYRLIQRWQQHLLKQLPTALARVEQIFIEQNINSTLIAKIITVIEKRISYLTRALPKDDGVSRIVK
jgi:serine/threonine-protein kinase HipA